MDRWFSRAAAAAMVGLAGLAGLARAQSVRVVTDAPSEPIVVSDGMPMVGGAPLTGPLAGPEGPAVPRGHFPHIRGLLMKHGIACTTSHNSPGCGSLKAECTFIFGSCRQFYGEPCFPGPLPSPSEMYYGVRAGGPGSAGPGSGAASSGCGCR